MKKYTISLLLLLTVLCTSSCLLLKPLKIGDIKSVKLLSANLATASLAIGMPITNPNFFDVKVDEANFEIFVNEAKVGNATLSKSITIPSHSDKVQDVYVTLKYDNLFGGIFALAGNHQIRVKCSGFANAKSLFFSKKIKVDVENNINLQQAFD